jgi:hypothetical protein
VKSEIGKKSAKMFFQNISKRKILLLIINALISILMISCVIFLYYYLPAATHQQQQRMFMVEKENSVHIMSSSKRTHGSSSSIVNANVRISNARRPSLAPTNEDQVDETPIDDTIYIDNDNYGDGESYADNSGNYEKPVTAPVTIIERPIERKKVQQQQQGDDDLYYENYDDTDDEDIVSSGNGKIVVNIKKPLPPTPEPPPSEPVVENVYSVSSEIVSNLKNQYNVDDSSATTKQINKPDDFLRESDDAVDGGVGDEWTVETNDAKGKRLIGNNKSLVERSRQLLLCESARTGELCRMLFKGTVD